MNQKQSYKELTLLGKVLPQAIEAEQAVLSAVMLESSAYATVENILTDSDFYDPKHQIVFKAITQLAMNKNPIDMLTVVNQLQTMGELENIGGGIFIAKLSDRVASSAHLEYHAKIVKQKSQARYLIELSSTISQMAFDETVSIEETLESIEQGLSSVNSNSSNYQSLDMKLALKQAVNQAETLQVERENGKLITIPTGLSNLDKAFYGGWRSPDLVVLGGRPSMGKTQHALAFAKSAGRAGKHCLFISIEMNANQLVNRFLLEDDRINTFNLHSGQMSDIEWRALNEKAGEFYNLPIHIADHHSIRYLNNIKSEARRLHRKGELDMMIIDYLGLIRTNLKFPNRYLEIGYITGELKSLAKELDIPIILLSQLSRPVKGQAVRQPQLEDLRESGDIEQDADVVVFIHKPDYYDKEAKMDDGTSWEGKGLLIVAKNRIGERNKGYLFNHDNRYKTIYDNSTDGFYLPNPNSHIEPSTDGDDLPF